MGIVCGFYRINNQLVDYLKDNPEDAYNYLGENYSSVNGKYHIDGDIVFHIDKAWDIAKFLLRKSDLTSDKVLQKLDGINIGPTNDGDGLRYIPHNHVKEIHGALEQLSREKLVAAYNQQELIENHVYRADWFAKPDWEYIFSHVDTMRKAFSRATETGDNIIVHFH